MVRFLSFGGGGPDGAVAFWAGEMGGWEGVGRGGGGEGCVAEERALRVLSRRSWGNMVKA